MEFISINPWDGSEAGRHAGHDDNQVGSILDRAAAAFGPWRKTPLKERCRLMSEAGRILRRDEDACARMITLEMGKPVSESRKEIQKCAWACDFYAENAERFLGNEAIATDGTRSYVRHDPIGCVLAVMPWNFPFWQVFRFAAPTLTAGNTALLKHASNVFGCAMLIESVFRQAGFPGGVFSNLVVAHDKVERIIAHPVIRGVSLTGSSTAGASVAAAAGRHLKRSLLELGGSNAFIVLEDADPDAAVALAVTARMQNCGQSCIAAKRFILVGGMHDAFVSRFIEAVGALKRGDPMNENTQVGPLARKDLAGELQRQVQASIDRGAALLHGGKQEGAFHEPTVLGDVVPGMPAFDEETFGPLAAMVRAADEADAFRLAGATPYGLGVTVCTRDTARAEALAGEVADGAFFVNELVKSDPRLPFGGEKNSGYGRELARDGILAFVNRKTVFVR